MREKLLLEAAIRPVTIGRLAAQTTVTRELVSAMLSDFMSTGEAKLWLDLSDGVATTAALDGPKLSISIGTETPD